MKLLRTFKPIDRMFLVFFMVGVILIRIAAWLPAPDHSSVPALRIYTQVGLVFLSIFLWIVGKYGLTRDGPHGSSPWVVWAPAILAAILAVTMFLWN